MKTNPTRRGFLASVAAATAATALPATAEARTPTTWGALRAGLPGLRAAYLAELERFAETLRPRFAAGELRAFRDCDDGIEDAPPWMLERLCASHFGVEVTRSEDGYGGEDHEGDMAAAYLILAASPRAEALLDTQVHPGYHAAEAAAWDVIAHARACGWYSPAPDESEDPLIGHEPCGDCGHGLYAHGDGKHEKAGCHVHNCGCSVRHAPHVPGRLA